MCPASAGAEPTAEQVTQQAVQLAVQVAQQQVGSNPTAAAELITQLTKLMEQQQQARQQQQQARQQQKQQQQQQQQKQQQQQAQSQQRPAEKWQRPPQKQQADTQRRDQQRAAPLPRRPPVPAAAAQLPGGGRSSDASREAQAAKENVQPDVRPAFMLEQLAAAVQQAHGVACGGAAPPEAAPAPPAVPHPAAGATPGGPLAPLTRHASGELHSRPNSVGPQVPSAALGSPEANEGAHAASGAAAAAAVGAAADGAAAVPGAPLAGLPPLMPPGKRARSEAAAAAAPGVAGGSSCTAAAAPAAAAVKQEDLGGRDVCPQQQRSDQGPVLPAKSNASASSNASSSSQQQMRSFTLHSFNVQDQCGTRRLMPGLTVQRPFSAEPQPDGLPRRSASPALPAQLAQLASAAAVASPMFGPSVRVAVVPAVGAASGTCASRVLLPTPAQQAAPVPVAAAAAAAAALPDAPAAVVAQKQPRTLLIKQLTRMDVACAHDPVGIVVPVEQVGDQCPCGGGGGGGSALLPLARPTWVALAAGSFHVHACPVAAPCQRSPTAPPPAPRRCCRPACCSAAATALACTTPLASALC
jgi:hypothetical protein